MKKQYSKPEIMFESFTLSVNIAGDCEKIVGNPAKMQCGINGSGGEVLFIDQSICSFLVDNDDYNGFCYHNPSDSANLFNS